MVAVWKAIAASTILTISTTGLADAHPDWLGSDSVTDQTNRICGSDAIPYLAQTSDQTQNIGVRCLKQNPNRRTSRYVSQLLWYGADQWQGRRSCQLGTAYTAAPTLPPVLAGEAINLTDDPPELGIPGLEPLSVQALHGTWPTPLKIQVQGGRNEVWIRISNAKTVQPLVSSLRNCDRNWQERYFNQPTPNPDWDGDRHDYDWLTRVGSGWHWLLRGPNK